ncbi:MAG: hypothetical protein FWF15_03240 [Oscillospiraceae bacterium]|nr:hypothetical protein [Oscillospiraceae bacterium]
MKPETKNSIRIGNIVSEDPSLFRELLETLNEYRNVVQQITLFISVSHSVMPLGTAKRQAEIFRERMKTAREYGFESGINILTTIGHHEENLDNSLHAEYTHTTNIGGNISLGCYCPNDENFKREYVTELYKIVVSAEPDYIWIDDDVRLCGHGPVTYTCFCDNCLNIFYEEFGKKYTRGELKAAFDKDLSLKWLQHNRNTLARLFAHIEKTVSEASEKVIPIGFMTGERYYEGYSFAEIADILKGDKERQVYWRPGGGAYTEEPLYEIIYKSHEIGRQVSLLPDHVQTIQAEIESFPYQEMKKSPTATAMEAAAYIAAGCTGAAYNITPDVITFTGETPKDSARMYDRLNKTQPFYDLLINTFGRAPHTGVFAGWTTDYWAAESDFTAGWTGHFHKYSQDLLDIGFPVAYSPENACVTTLYGNAVKVMSANLIEKLLSGGVYMDAGALINLNEMGYGGLTGFAVKDFKYKDCMEYFTDHDLNSDIPAGTGRNSYQAFYGNAAGVIEPTNPLVQILSTMKDYSGNVLSECSMGVFENSLGGRICIAGYAPWTFLHSRPKVKQLKNVFRYLSKDTLPSFTESYCKLQNWTRRLDNGGLGAALLNPSLETLQDTVILLKTESSSCFVYDMNCERIKLNCSFNQDGYKAFKIPVIEPWKMVLLTTI